MMKIYLIIVVLILIGCGRKSSPKPYEATTLKIEGLEAIQRGDQIRLSWTLPETLPLETASRQFVIEEQVIEDGCLNCVPIPLKHYVVPFPSQHIRVSETNVVFYLPPISYDFYIHLYQVFYQTREGQNIATPQTVQFGHFVRIPKPSKTEISAVSPDNRKGLEHYITLPDKLEHVQIFKWSWEPQLEKAELKLSAGGELLQKKSLYGINIYRIRQGESWSDYPPWKSIEQSYFYFYNEDSVSPIQDRPYVPLNNSFLSYYGQYNWNYLYQVRLRDSQGNEGEPGETFMIRMSQRPSLPDVVETQESQNKLAPDFLKLLKIMNN